MIHQNSQAIFSILFYLPNKRAEYYRIIDDIKKITGVQIYTLTIGLLIALMLSNKKLTNYLLENFIINSKNYNMNLDKNLKNITKNIGGLTSPLK